MGLNSKIMRVLRSLLQRVVSLTNSIIVIHTVIDREEQIENINKRIRRFLTKGTSFKGLSRNKVKRIQEFINTYPRKIFELKTAKEVLNTKNQK